MSNTLRAVEIYDRKASSHNRDILSLLSAVQTHRGDIQIGKCQGCNQTVYDVNNMTDDIKRKMREYRITSVPITIIDGNIKVVGIPDFPWICGDDLYKKLKRE